MIDGKRLKVHYHTQLYQRRITRAFDKRVRQYDIKDGDLVLRQAKQNLIDPREKFQPNWEGPYLVKTILSKGAVKLMNVDGNEFSEWINVARLK